MSEYEYLKKVDYAEREVYEISGRLAKTKNEYNKAMTESAQRKEGLLKNRNELNEKLKEAKRNINENVKSYKPVNKKTLLFTIIMTTIAFIVVQAGLYGISYFLGINDIKVYKIILFCISQIIGLLIVWNIVYYFSNYSFDLMYDHDGVPIGVGVVSGIITIGLYIFFYKSIPILYIIMNLLLYPTLIVVLLIMFKISNNKKFNKYYNHKKSYEREFSELTQKHSIACDEYERFCLKMDQSLSKMRNDISKIEAEYKNKMINCNKLYDQGIIYPDYRNWKCVCIFIKYFEMGLCTSLKGSNGAYSIYRKEALGEKTYDAVKGVSVQVSSLSARQYSMERQMEAINDKLDRIVINRYGI